MSTLNTTVTNLQAPADQPSSSSTAQQTFNVLELTLLFKVMGFRLHYLDYESGPPPNHADLTVEIKCGKQNLVARLSVPGDTCGCPTKKEEQELDSSFWEVVGTGPNASPNGKRKVQDASSNLLPDLSKRGVANTKQLLNLVFEGFRKDHLPSATPSLINQHYSPEVRPGIPLNPIHTSTVLKSPQRRLMPMMTLQDDFPGEPSPQVLMAPPNTPRLGNVDAFGSLRNKDHLVYMEVMAARERLDKALLAMKMNIAGDLGHLHGPALDLSAQKILEGVSSAATTPTTTPLGTPTPMSSGMSPATFVRRSSLGAFPNIKSKVDDVKKKQPLVRNKSSIDAGAATKSKTTAVTSRYLQPKKLAAAGDPAVAKKASPLTRKTPGAVGSATKATAASATSAAKRSPVGWK